jgi:dTDP-glucose 4,6-dehydratase
MRVLITGGAGFIGSHLVDHYLGSNHQVTVVDSLITGREENIAHHQGKKDFVFLKDDICNLRPIDGPLDLVLHFASPASPFDYLKYPIETMKTASLGTYNLLELARNKKAKILLASTSEVYGDPLVHPQREDYWGNVNPIGPRAVYDEGKRFAEAMAMAYSRKYGVKTIIIRIFNTYGERMRAGDGRVIPTFITEALKNRPLPIFGDGSQTRSFCYISDMVEGIARAAQINEPAPINLGNPNEYTVKKLAEIVKRLCHSSSGYEISPLPENDPQRRRPDISRAKKVLGWEPRVGLEEGLRNVIGWFRGRDG